MTISPVDLLFLNACTKVSEDSFDPHRPVGSILVDSANNLISSGTNRPPSSLNITQEELHTIISEAPQAKYYLIEHAERNALYAAYQQKRSVMGSTIYCSLFPCADCARAIVAAGVVRVVTPTSSTNNKRDDKWLEHYLYAREIFKLANVQMDEVTRQE